MNKWFIYDLYIYIHIQIYIQIYKAFDAIDADGDGYIDKIELALALRIFR